MAYGRELSAPKTTGQTPSGRQSWTDAHNQAKGNINWMLSFLEPEEIMAKIVEQEFRQKKDIYPVSKRYRYLQRLKTYISSMRENCLQEIERIENHADPEDLEADPESLEEAIHSE